MGAAPGDSPPPAHRSWRAPLAAIVLASLAVLALALAWLSRPEQVARLVLAQVGRATGLEVTAAGASEYRLRGAPTLVVRDVVARRPGSTAPLLTAGRIHLSLPWSTVRSRGSELTVERVELDEPRLRLDELQAWFATRPPAGASRVPTITDGIGVVDGEVRGDGWSVDRIGLSLPSLAPTQPLQARTSGQLRTGDTQVPFDLQLVLDRPAMDAAVGAAGKVGVLAADWRMALRPVLSARMLPDADGPARAWYRLSTPVRYQTGDVDLAFALGVAGVLDFDDGLALRPLALATRGRGAVPTLAGRGTLHWREALGLQLEGTLERWPDAWPPLPPPLDSARGRLPFAVAYDGPLDLSGRTRLELRHPGAHLSGHFRLPAVVDWFDRLQHGNPLPPMNAALSAPRLEVAGAVLHGVELSVSDEGTAQ